MMTNNLVIRPSRIQTFVGGSICLFFAFAGLHARIYDKGISGAVSIFILFLFGIFFFLMPYIYTISIDDDGLLIAYNKIFIFWVTSAKTIVPWRNIKRIEWWGGVNYAGGYHVLYTLPLNNKERRIILNFIWENRASAMRIIVAKAKNAQIEQVVYDKIRVKD